jgi:hypothetical protein
MSKSKAKGTAAETAVVEYLKEWFPRCERRTTSGSNDRGDINLGPSYLRNQVDVVIEVKNHRVMALPEWIKEANVEAFNANVDIGVVWHKRVGKGSPADWYVTMDGATFTDILLKLGEGK